MDACQANVAETHERGQAERSACQKEPDSSGQMPYFVGMRNRLAGPLAAIVVLAGCGDGTGVQNFSPVATGQKINTAFAALDNNKAVQSMDVLSGAFTFSGAAPVLPGMQGSAASPAGIFPCTACIGKTFAY